MKHLIMDHTGHSTIEFDKADPAQLKEARERFEKLVGEAKCLAATRKEGESDFTKITSFDEQKDETLFSPQYKGG